MLCKIITKSRRFIVASAVGTCIVVGNVIGLSVHPSRFSETKCFYRLVPCSLRSNILLGAYPWRPWPFSWWPPWKNAEKFKNRSFRNSNSNSHRQAKFTSKHMFLRVKNKTKLVKNFVVITQGPNIQDGCQFWPKKSSMITKSNDEQFFLLLKTCQN